MSRVKIDRQSPLHPACLVASWLADMELRRAELDMAIKAAQREYDRWNDYEFPDQEKYEQKKTPLRKTRD